MIYYPKLSVCIFRCSPITLRLQSSYIKTGNTSSHSQNEINKTPLRSSPSLKISNSYPPAIKQSANPLISLILKVLTIPQNYPKTHKYPKLTNLLDCFTLLGSFLLFHSLSEALKTHRPLARSITPLSCLFPNCLIRLVLIIL